LGLVSLTIESAGSSEEEIILAALHEQHAEQIRQSIARSRAVASSHPSAQVTDEELLVTRETRDLFIHGISSNQAWLVVAGFIGAYSQMPDAWQLDSDAFVEVLPSGLLESSAVQMVLLGLALVLTGFALMLALSVLASLLIYGNFELRRVRDGFAARQGAISSKVLNMRQRRIQTVTVRQNWIARYFARFNLSLEQISHSQSGAETAGRLLIPAVTMTQSAELTTTALDGPPMLIAAESFSRVSSYYLRKRWLWLGAIYALAIILVSSNSFSLAIAANQRNCADDWFGSVPKLAIVRSSNQWRFSDRAYRPYWSQLRGVATLQSAARYPSAIAFHGQAQVSKRALIFGV
jgi:putative membrane protein